MAGYRIIVSEKEGLFDAVGNSVLRDIHALGFDEVIGARLRFIYYLEGALDEKNARYIAEELLIDKVTQEYSLNPKPQTQNPEPRIEIAYNPGVMDPQEESILKAISDMGISGVSSARTAREYSLEGEISQSVLSVLAEKVLYNKVIQHIVKLQVTSHTHAGAGNSQVDYKFKLVTVDLLGAADKKLLEISKGGQLFLNLAEMLQIKNHFKKMGRKPTDCELETIAQTWSEHCGHKTFRGRIEYKEVTGHRSQVTGKKQKITIKIINNLLKSTIMKVTRELNKPWCVSVFKDNSGIIEFDEKNNICFKVETHNHPSALEPFGGANTGIGGVIRDPMGTGLGARPFLNTDVFCFGEPDYPDKDLPPSVLSPRRVAKGVVSGVRDYGNKMGIPTVNGAVLFDKGYLCNPLVYCGTAGILPKWASFKKVSPGDLIVAVGGRTGRDGIHGATFSSGELTEVSEKVSGSAVQIGNPITEKKVLDTLLRARDLRLYSALTDCGAGGFSSAVGEMAEGIGARVYLDKAPLKYHGLRYDEIWISEAQERMVLAVKKNNRDKLLALFLSENVEATVIGEFVETGRLELFYEENKVADLDLEFLYKGLPPITKKALWMQPKHKEPKTFCPKDLTSSLKQILSHYDVASKEWIIRQYDHEVQGGSVLRPLVGVANDGPSDAAVVKPCLDSSKGVVVSNGINFKFGMVDPYWMAASCIDEALRQIIAVGGSLKKTALLDNFCWGNPDKPDRLGSLVRASLGCYKTALGFGTPFISGKDSLYNEYAVKGKSCAIPGTLLISAISVMGDTGKVVSMDLKEEGNLLYVIGDTFCELGGSHYFDILGYMGNNVPQVNVKKAKLLMDKLSVVTSKGIVRAMHDCSEGGLGVTLAEMAFAGELGANIFLKDVPYEVKSQKSKVKSKKSKNADLRNDYVLFSESNSRFVAEVKKEDQKEFERTLNGVSWGLIGCVSGGSDFKVYGLDGKICIEDNIYNLKEAWAKPLRW